MELLLCLLVASTLPHWTMPEPSSDIVAVIELASGGSRVFSGERVQFKCSVPGRESTNWRYRWFHGAELLVEFESYTVWKARPDHSGDYHCQGVRDTDRGPLETQRSLPLFIDVDGGWVILQATPPLVLIGESVTLTCRVRGYRPDQVILYKDGAELKTVSDPQVLLTVLTLEDRGSYWCRATWVERSSVQHSAVSSATRLSVEEPVSEPHLKIQTQDVKWLLLTCQVRMTARKPAPTVNYYFYQDGELLAPSTDQDHFRVERSPGKYQCRTRVPDLGAEKWSEPTPYGPVGRSRRSRSAPAAS